MKLREKLNARMDEIQRIMEANEHLADPDKVTDLLDKVTFAWEVLSEEDRDYIHGVQDSLRKNGMETEISPSGGIGRHKGLKIPR